MLTGLLPVAACVCSCNNDGVEGIAGVGMIRVKWQDVVEWKR